MYVIVKAAGSSFGVAPIAKQLLDEIDPKLAILEETNLKGYLHDLAYPARVGAAVSGAFGLLALLVASLGVYTVTAKVTEQRTREFGVRRALGASTNDIVVSSIRPALVPAAIGCLLGLSLFIGTTRVLGSFIFRMPSADLLTCLTALFIFVVVGGIGVGVPASRAMRLDPAAALRQL